MNANACPRWLGPVRSSVVVLGFVLGTFVACDSEDDTPDEPSGDPADCRLISNWCHSYDAESDIAHECHETGHDGSSPARCTELKATCRETCPPREPDSGTGGSSGGGAAGSGTGTGGGGATSTGGASGDDSGGAAGSDGTAGQGSGATGTGGNGGAASGGTTTGGSAGSSVTAGSGGARPDGGETACEMLGRICHGIGPGVTEDCHELGHGGDEPACEAELATCLAACQDGGA